MKTKPAALEDIRTKSPSVVFTNVAVLPKVGGFRPFPTEIGAALPGPPAQLHSGLNQQVRHGRVPGRKNKFVVDPLPSTTGRARNCNPQHDRDIRFTSKSNKILNNTYCFILGPINFLRDPHGDCVGWNRGAKLRCI